MSRRRWLRGLAAAAVAVVIAPLALYGWAWSSPDRSTIARALMWRESDVDDQHRFPARRIPAGRDVSPLPAGAAAISNVAPDADAVVVRPGSSWGVDNVTWLATLRDVADRLANRS